MRVKILFHDIQVSCQNYKVFSNEAIKLLGDVLGLLLSFFMEKGTSILNQKPKECWNDLLSAYLLAPVRGETTNLIGENYECFGARFTNV